MELLGLSRSQFEAKLSKRRALNPKPEGIFDIMKVPPYSRDHTDGTTNFENHRVRGLSIIGVTPKGPFKGIISRVISSVISGTKSHGSPSMV